MKQEDINSIRAFNRYYTKLLGVLNKYYLGSEFGLPEIRVIQDIYLHPDRSSKDISGELNMDKGLLSRLLKQLEQKGYIYRKGTERDNRMGLINLTEKGCEIYHHLDATANQSVEEIFAHLNNAQLQDLINSMDSIYNIMNEIETNIAPKNVEPIIIRSIEEEDNIPIARILRASVEEHGAPKIGTFYDDPHTDMMFQTFDIKNAEYWVVECSGEILGGGGFYPTKGLPKGYAELSKFHFRPELRGKGIGKRLLRLIEQRAIKAGYTHMYIVSYHQFGNAVAMYEKYGYEHINRSLDESGLYQDAPFHMVKKLLKKV
ncbi:helix-turn-helix domain-containing GNAT family N-acetyltransferase [uncultured Parabacteroides sp.]|uniref:bifunctional helix-turn-helix transcriptional regulator/GNAT family N-acetyltransferase n=1 Tax=uncultured Parabacteroides sp. TaxID=512312 RepID=UPI00260FFC4A|nr:helix-turn-helix domain-containing GNAT family N-acetyltransferase [uncultured Parabacteroides sp.]